MQPDYSSDRRKCPLYYEKLKYADIRDRRVVPYLLGGRQKPHCRHCNSNAPWAKFCSWDFSKFSKWACFTFFCRSMHVWLHKYILRQSEAMLTLFSALQPAHDYILRGNPAYQQAAHVYYNPSHVQVHGPSVLPELLLNYLTITGTTEVMVEALC